MDRQLIEEMKQEADLTYRRNIVMVNGEAIAMQAIQAYAALCQVEVLHDLNSPQMSDAELREIMGNRTDQSIVDALSE